MTFQQWRRSRRVQVVAGDYVARFDYAGCQSGEHIRLWRNGMFCFVDADGCGWPVVGMEEAEMMLARVCFQSP